LCWFLRRPNHFEGFSSFILSRYVVDLACILFYKFLITPFLKFVSFCLIAQSKSVFHKRKHWIEAEAVVLLAKTYLLVAKKACAIYVLIRLLVKLKQLIIINY